MHPTGTQTSSHDFNIKIKLPSRSRFLGVSGFQKIEYSRQHSIHLTLPLAGIRSVHPSAREAVWLLTLSNYLLRQTSPVSIIIIIVVGFYIITCSTAGDGGEKVVQGECCVRAAASLLMALLLGISEARNHYS